MRLMLDSRNGKKRDITDKAGLLLLSLFLLADSRFFYLCPLPSNLSGSASNKLLLGIFAIICVVGMSILGNKFKLGHYGFLIIGFYIILVIHMFVIKKTFDYNIKTIVAYYLPYIILIMYFTSIKLLEDKENFIEFIKIIEIIIVILSIILITQLYIYNKYHRIFLNFTLSDWYTIYHIDAKGRFYSVVEGINRVAIPLAMYNFYIGSKSGKFYSLVALIMGLLNVVIVDQSRVYFIQEVVAIIVMIIVVYGKKITLNKLLYSLIAITISIVVLWSKIKSIIITIIDYDGSAYARNDAIRYYLDIGKSYLLSGMGVAIPDKGSINYFLIKGPNGVYNYDDIGIFGVFASMGIIVVIWYLIVTVKNFLVSSKINDTYMKSLAYGLSSIMLTGLGTMSYLDSARIISLLLTMVVIECGYILDKRGKFN